MECPQSEVSITGTLKDAVWDEYHPCIWGFIYGDVHGRFPDGTWIHTSKVKTNWGAKLDLVPTLNSLYRVHWKE